MRRARSLRLPSPPPRRDASSAVACDSHISPCDSTATLSHSGVLDRSCRCQLAAPFALATRPRMYSRP